ncbi:28S ribosomal protein S15, mitochondrial, partial [Stegodyphus mimosarum]
MTMLAVSLRANFFKIICFKQYNYPLIIESYGRRDGISMFSTCNYYLQTGTSPENEAQPAPKKYKNPVDWLPFAWHRRPMFNIFEQSGDLVKNIEFDPNWCKPDFELSEELKSADDQVKKIFSLSTASKSEVKEVCRRNLLKRIQRHPHDFDSLEVKIALKTLQVRSLFEHKILKWQEVKGGRIILPIIIQKRNKLLNQLRIIDNERFCWLLKELQLEYTPEPLQFHYEKYCKKWDLRRLTKEYCEKTIADKKAAYHEALKEQQ